MTIRVYNTLTRTKEDFIPRKSGEVSIYVCGVTPYSQSHLGHARPSVVWDVIKKYLRYLGLKVFHVQNFTDVDDKIIARAQEEGVSPLELSKRFMEEYLSSMDALGVERADLYPKVSDHIREIMGMIQSLVQKGHAYESNGNVFFDVTSFEEYGKLSRQRLDELYEGTRFAVDPGKRNSVDFALWKSAKPGEISWESPWGLGRPGWHIECSAMSEKYLGAEFDFHGGGTDLIFPHHENEIAQSEAATGKPSARYWLHNGMLTLRTEKMSKSTGNFITIDDILGKHPKELFRFYLLSNHYRSELEYHDCKLDEVRKGWERLNECVCNIARILEGGELKDTGDEQSGILMESCLTAEQKFNEAMQDDFNTALAIASLFDLARDTNSYLSTVDKPNLTALTKVHGIFRLFGEDMLGIIGQTDQTYDGLVEPLVDMLLALRQELRVQKNFALADNIRNQLGELGIVVEDTPQGSRWKR